MWVSATILAAHTQKESGVHGYDIATRTWICAVNRSLEAEGLPGEPCRLYPLEFVKIVMLVT